jgi:soluble lytic murein transglycosylase
MIKRKLQLFFFCWAFMVSACNFSGFIPENDTPPIENTESPVVPTTLPTPTAIATAPPFVRMESGEKAYKNGNWDLAITEFTDVINQNANPESSASALLGLGKTHYQIGNLDESISYLTQSLEIYPSGNHAPTAMFTLGLAYEQKAEYSNAITAFENYQLLRNNIIGYYVFAKIGDLYFEIEEYSDAITAYQKAINSDSILDPLSLTIKIGNAYKELGDENTAIITYQDVINRTGNDYTHANMNYEIGEILRLQDLKEESYFYYYENILQFPLSYYAYLSLVVLLEENQPIDEYQRGLIDYYAQQYGVSIEAFDRYLASAPAQHSDAAHFYKGLALREVAQTEAAMNEWNEQIETHYNERLYANAIDEISYTQWVYLDDTESGIDTLLGFIDDFPEHEKSAEFLYLAGRMAEGDGDLYRASQLWQRLGIQFSNTEYAANGLFQAGIANYRLRKYDQAISNFQGALGLAETNSQQSSALFWLGKTNSVKGFQAEANNAYLQASTADPTGYYSVRANYYLTGETPFSSPEAFTKTVDIKQAKEEAEIWLKSTFNLPVGLDLDGIGSLANDPRMVRGTELWNLGLLEQGRAELESLRFDNQNNAENSYRLANYFIEISLYRSAIIAARQVLNLAGFDDTTSLTAPHYFNWIRFGFYYQDLIFPIAEEYQIDPFLLYSIIRQESLFEGFITSSVGARGLMQIMPATGNDIYTNTGWPTEYTEDDLYRPYISITFGAEYLSRQRNYFEGDIYAMLAAYNGGPGNAISWLSIANEDPDLFTEVIRFEETRRYIRSIFEIYDIYKFLYEVD